MKTSGVQRSEGVDSLVCLAMCYIGFLFFSPFDTDIMFNMSIYTLFAEKKTEP